MRTSLDELSVYHLGVNCFKGRKKKMDIQIELINLIIKIYPGNYVHVFTPRGDG